ncbi:MAG: threonine synthase, partial [bacterium]
PFYRSFVESFATRHRVAAETVASAIRIGDPVSHDRAVAAIRDTRGVVTEVSDEELMAAKRRIDGMGIGCEPASATTLAGVERLRREGTIGERERVVCVLTGHLLKDPESAYRPEGLIEVEPTVAAVEAVLAP